MAKPKKPSVTELEKMMDEGGNKRIHINPDGSIETREPETETEELARLRKENGDLRIANGQLRQRLSRIEKAVAEGR